MEIKKRYILHIDVNNAFLSWTAVDLLKNGFEKDIRCVPAIIGGDQSMRHGIVLAKSSMAKKVGIKTAMPISNALKICPSLEIYSSNMELYRNFSNELFNLYSCYTDKIERYSIDECFLDMTYFCMGKDIFEIAKEIQNNVFEKFGFTVNIGISDKKLLAKIASDFEKPNKIHTLFSHEVSKIYNLPLSNLFMLGKSTQEKMNSMRIFTIGELANSDFNFISKRFGKHGEFLHNLANGIDDSQVEYIPAKRKNIGKEITLPEDISDIDVLNNFLVSISRKLATSLKKENLKTKCIAIVLKTSSFIELIHQRKLNTPTDNSKDILENAKALLKEKFSGEKIRLIGIRCSNLVDEETDVQLSFFEDNDKSYVNNIIDNTMDKINTKFSKDVLIKASELNVKKMIEKKRQ